jgi:hypothetical protein
LATGKSVTPDAFARNTEVEWARANFRKQCLTGMLWVRHKNFLVKNFGFFCGLAVFASVNFSSISTLPAQTDSLVSSAPASPPPTPLDVITFASGQTSRSHSTAGRFAPVNLNPLETAAIKLQFATTFAGTPVTVQSLDGGAAESINSSARMVASPDGAYKTCWVDLQTNRQLLQRRFIFVFEISSNRLLFTHATFQRYTGAVWNDSSTACAIFDAPDNANVYLWLLLKPENSKVSDWSVRQIDLEKLSAEKLSGVSRAKVVRTGLEQMSWDSNDFLNVALIVNNQPVILKIPAR